MKPIIETEGLRRHFGRTEAVRELTFAVPEGSIYAFLGPNGAGKTTTIKMLLNILQPSMGSARILGVDSKDLGPRELAQIGYVSENQQLPEWMTVRQLIDYCKPMYPTWDDAFCEKLLKSFNLPPQRKLKNLSRGAGAQLRENSVARRTFRNIDLNADASTHSGQYAAQGRVIGGDRQLVAHAGNPGRLDRRHFRECCRVRWRDVRFSRFVDRSERFLRVGIGRGKRHQQP